MNHLGDITKISGYTAPTVDCIIGGSPCQDLSVAGKRAGLDGERSGLFMEQIRIIKEMRENDRRNGRTDESVRPRYMVWENVPGAFSSNKGEDFRIVLEETAKIADDKVSIPRPKDGKWTNNGCIVADGWSLAWRVFDAQFWGVPQRRRRIALVADFGGQSAPEILFVRKSLSRDSEQSHEKRKETPSDATGSVGASDCFCIQGAGETSRTAHGDGINRDVSFTINSVDKHGVAYTMQDREGKDGGGKGFLLQEDRSAALRTANAQYLFQPCNWDGTQVSPTLTANNAGGSQRMPDKDNFNCVIQPVMETKEYYAGKFGYCMRFGNKLENDKIPSLETSLGDNTMSVVIKEKAVVPVTYAVDMGGGKSAVDVIKDKSPTLTTTHYGEPAVVYDARGNGDGNTVPTITGDHENRITDYTAVAVYRKQAHPMNAEQGQGWEEADKNDTLNAYDNTEARTPTVVVMDRYAYNSGINAKFDMQISEDGIAYTETERPGAVAYAYPEVGDGTNLTESETNGALQASMAHNTHSNNVVRIKYIVRRLTPMECERLQGYPDHWTDIGEYVDSKGKKHQTADSNRYKALGNSIALPSWRWVLNRLCGCYERNATMASLFDGIGGFPLIWESINGKGSCLWASEIEEFPIAVTKERIG